MAVDGGTVSSDASRNLTSETWELAAKHSTNRVSDEMSSVALRNDQAISAASGDGGVAAATAVDGGLK